MHRATDPCSQSPGEVHLVTKPTKSRKERRVPILEPLRPVLERLTEGKRSEDALLVGPKGGYLTTATVRDATDWDSIVAKLGLPDLTRNGLRHTGATWMADAVIPLHVLQDILGHAAMETTRGYLHPDDRHLASAAEQANAFLSAAGQRKAGPAQRPLGQALVMCAGACRSSRAGVLVPFWSPYPQRGGSRRFDCTQATARRHSRGTTENHLRT